MGGRPNLVYSPGPGLWSLFLGPFGPDLGPGPGPELDNNKYKNIKQNIYYIYEYSNYVRPLGLLVPCIQLSVFFLET